MARIIAAEDDAIVAQILQETLIAAGHAVGVIPEGEAAFAVIRSKRPSLVILDCNLPGISGVDIVRKLRIDPDLWDLPALMLTGRTSDADRAVAMYAGATRYMCKPFDPARLVFAVNDMLREDAARREQRTLSAFSLA